jgi:hypothetical protein
MNNSTALKLNKRIVAFYVPENTIRDSILFLYASWHVQLFLVYFHS